MSKKKNRLVIQTHHISYEPEVTTKMYQGEHWLVTNMMRRKHISKGFLKTLKIYIALHEDNAEDLE